MRFDVTIQEHTGSTRHVVTLSRSDCHRLAGPDCPPGHCIEAAMRFLLEREPKESILPRFDISVIGRYFPEFEQSLADYL
jgi:hypothetical protein